MSRVLLDTDIFSEILKQRDPLVTGRAVAYRKAEGRFTISVVSAMEIAAGLHRVKAEKQYERFLASSLDARSLVWVSLRRCSLRESMAIFICVERSSI